MHWGDRRALRSAMIERLIMAADVEASLRERERDAVTRMWEQAVPWRGRTRRLHKDVASIGTENGGNASARGPTPIADCLVSRGPLETADNRAPGFGPPEMSTSSASQIPRRG